VIRDSFKTVSDEFSLTKQNSPTHPSFITGRRLTEIKSYGLKFFGLYTDGSQTGFLAIEDAGDGVFHFEDLAVLPAYRHCGYGRALLSFGLEYARTQKGKRIEIGIINEHEVLKGWYLSLGFKLRGVKNFLHLPFTVCFMERNLSPLE
jgi:ribosomal protein S18 acetylase RimI-like enzyme